MSLISYGFFEKKLSPKTGGGGGGGKKQCHKMSHWGAKKFHVLFDWPLGTLKMLKFVSSQRQWSLIGGKALQKAEYSDFCSFTKFETQNIPNILYVSKLLRQNQIFFPQITCSDSNFNQKFNYEFGTQGLNWWSFAQRGSAINFEM